MFHSKLTFLALFIMLLTGSCASIVGGTSSNLYIRTEPRQAQIVIADKKGREVFNGKGPAQVKLQNGAGYFTPARYTVSVSADGYLDQEFTVNFRLNGWYFGNLAIGGVLGMIIIDPISGGMWKIEDGAIDAQLERNSAYVSPHLRIYTPDTMPEDLKGKMVRIK